MGLENAVVMLKSFCMRISFTANIRTIFCPLTNSITKSGRKSGIFCCSLKRLSISISNSKNNYLYILISKVTLKSSLTNHLELWRWVTPPLANNMQNILYIFPSTQAVIQHRNQLASLLLWMGNTLYVSNFNNFSSLRIKNFTIRFTSICCHTVLYILYHILQLHIP